MSAIAGLVAGVQRQRRLTSARLVRVQRRWRSAIDALVAGVQRQRWLVHTRLVHVQRVCLSVITGLVVELGRERQLVQARLIQLQGTCVSAITRLRLYVGRQRRLLHARLGHIQRVCRLVIAGLEDELGRQRQLLYARLVRFQRMCISAIVGPVAGVQRQRRLVYTRLVRHRSRARAARRRVVVPERTTRYDLLERTVLSRTATLAERRPLRARFAWAFAGALAGIALAAATATALVTMHSFGSTGKTVPRASNKPQSALRVVNESSPQRATSRVPVAHDGPLAPKHVTRPSARPAPRVTQTPSQQTRFVSNAVQNVSAHAAREASPTVAAPAAIRDGAAPLPAPTGASAPSPLRAP